MRGDILGNISVMEIFSHILGSLRTALAARAGRDRALAALVLVVWGRLGRMAQRFERLVAQWRARTLPLAQEPRAGGARPGRERKTSDGPRLPDGPGWLVGYVRDVAVYGSQLEHFLSGEECKRFLAEVPQAGRIVRPLLRMLGVGVVLTEPRKARPVWGPPVVQPAVVAPAGLVMGPGGRLIWV
jgi:hypothetical protein